MPSKLSDVSQKNPSGASTPKAKPVQSSANVGELKELLMQQKEILDEIKVQTEKTRKYIMWGKIMTFIYFILIVAPIVLAIIYLPPIIEEAVGPYKSLLEKGPVGASVESGFLDRLIDQVEAK